jgi:hypothetical protein
MQDEGIAWSDKFFESESKFKYLGSILGSGNGANIYSRILCLHLLSRNIQIAKYTTAILIFFTWVWNLVTHTEGET